MKLVKRVPWVVALLLAGCPAPESEPPPSAPVEDPQPKPAVEPEATAPIEDPGIAGPELETRTFRFTTLVTGGSEAFERLIGSNGYYELVIEGEKATLRKVGQKGTPVFADDQIQTGAATLVTAPTSEWPAAEHHTLDIELSDGKSRRRLVFDLWFLADEVHGTWAAPNPADDSHVGDTWGLVQGRRDTGDPIDLQNGADAPCMVCTRAFWNCDGISFDEPACNSAESSHSKCEARLDKAQKSAGELPRGCDDYFM